MATDALLEEMGVQRADAEVQQAAASVEAEKVGTTAQTKRGDAGLCIDLTFRVESSLGRHSSTEWVDDIVYAWPLLTPSPPSPL